jgi:fructose-bisphosphate aldolase class 1
MIVAYRASAVTADRKGHSRAVSGSPPGQAPEQATGNLAGLRRMPRLWPLTFCFGRALAGPALTARRGQPARPARASAPWCGAWP